MRGGARGLEAAAASKFPESVLDTPEVSGHRAWVGACYCCAADLRTARVRRTQGAVLIRLVYTWAGWVTIVGWVLVFLSALTVASRGSLSRAVQAALSDMLVVRSLRARGLLLTAACAQNTWEVVRDALLSECYTMTLGALVIRAAREMFEVDYGDSLTARMLLLR
jgi:hypothetical protein